MGGLDKHIMLTRTFIAIGLLTITGNVARAASPTTHVEFPVEYDEVRVLDAGKVVQFRKFVRNSKEESAFFHDIDLQIFKQLGVKNLKEVLDKKMWQTYTAERAKRVAVKSLPTINPNVFRIVDENNKELHHVDLGHKTQFINANSFSAEKIANIYTKPGDLEAPKQGEIKGELTTSNLLYSNKPKTFFLILRTIQYSLEGEQNGCETFSKAVLFDSTGKEHWSNDFPAGVGVSNIGDNEPKITDNGEITIISTYDAEEHGAEILHLFDITGKEVLRYPGEEAPRETPRPRHYHISSDGRYLSILNSKGETIFWDVQTRKSYQTSLNIVNKITPDGIADIEIYGAYKKIVRTQLDLKQHLK